MSEYLNVLSVFNTDLEDFTHPCVRKCIGWCELKPVTIIPTQKQ